MGVGRVLGTKGRIAKVLIQRGESRFPANGTLQGGWFTR